MNAYIETVFGSDRTPRCYACTLVVTAVVSLGLAVIIHLVIGGALRALVG